VGGCENGEYEAQGRMEVRDKEREPPIILFSTFGKLIILLILRRVLHPMIRIAMFASSLPMRWRKRDANHTNDFTEFEYGWGHDFDEKKNRLSSHKLV